MPLEGLNSLQKKIENIGDNLDTMPDRRIKRQYGTMTGIAQAKIQAQDASASGELMRSFRQKEIDFPNRRAHIWENEAPHGAFVEFGTGDQHRPNPHTDHFKAPSYGPRLRAAIERWIQEKPTFALHGTLEDTARKIALSLAGYISGTPSGQAPQPFFEPTWFERKNIVKGDIKLGVKQAVRRA